MPDRTPQETVQANIDAYNAKDIAAFASTYAAEAKFCKIDGTVLLADCKGIAAFRGSSTAIPALTARSCSMS